MYTVEVERQTVNIALLERDLRSLCGDVYTGLTTRPGLVIAYLSDNADAALLDPVRRTLIDHDASRLTEEQAKAAAAKAALEAARRNQVTPLHVADYGQDALLLRLAEKIAWLEREIRDLRGIPSTVTAAPVGTGEVSAR